MAKLLSKIRLLPITIFAAALMLSVKISDIVDGFSGPPDGLPIAQANAQEPPREAPPQTQPFKPAPLAEEGERRARAEQDQPAPSTRSALDDPTLFTQSEIDLLQQLADRREFLEARGQELDRREAMMAAAERRINKKIDEMQGLEGAIKKLIKVHGDQQEDQMRSLVKIYENMKPKDAARIFEELNLETLLLVVERMKERKLAPIMAQMNPQKATEMTVKLSQRRRLPEPGSQIGG